MTEPMTPEQLTESACVIERAHSEVGAICKDGASRRWRMSIPAQPDRDSDLILSAGLKAGEHALAEVERLRTLVRDLTDPDPCYFDHHGGCQAHGYLSLEPGEKCPHAEAKELFDAEGSEVGS